MTTERYIIPTRYKAKIARTMSWPVDAEEISASLAAAPQVQELEITFSNWSRAKLSASWMTLLTASYSKRSQDIFTDPTSWELLQMRHWSLHVSAVPRTERKRLHDNLLEQLPRIAEWLTEHADRQAMGGLSIHVVWNKQKETVYCSSTSSVETEVI